MNLSVGSVCFCDIKLYSKQFIQHVSQLSYLSACYANYLKLQNVRPFPPSAFTSFYGTMSESDFLSHIWFPSAFLCFGFHTLIQGYDRTSAVPINYLSSTSPSSLTGGSYLNLALPIQIVLSATITTVST